jgi:hypothetical protein
MPDESGVEVSSVQIDTVTGLLNASFDDIEYGRVVVTRKKAGGERVLHSGRIVDRSFPFVTLRQGEYSVDVNLTEYSWELTDWIPVRSPIEKQMIQKEYQ